MATKKNKYFSRIETLVFRMLLKLNILLYYFNQSRLQIEKVARDPCLTFYSGAAAAFVWAPLKS
jgi:hypothetical protein